jgi:SPP1 gp7 family putative phage head morphogenesis protein
MFDRIKFAGAITVGFKRVTKAALQSAGEKLFDELGLEDPWTTPDIEAVKFLHDRDPKWKSASDRVAKRITNILEEGLAAGDGRDEMVKSIREEFNAIGKKTATMIAQTETTAAYNFGRQTAMAKGGTPQKEWVNSRGPNVRPTHQEADGQIVDVNEPFIVGGSEMMFPGDSSRGAGPEETINCYCLAAPVGGEAEEEPEMIE